MTANRLTGVFAAIVTPVTAAGRPDHARFLTHARWLMDHGCDGLNVLGTTGEATSFAADDRIALMEAAAEALSPERLMVGTGCPDLPTTLRLTRAAGRLGFGAALVLPPYYYKGVADVGLESYFRRLADATDTPLYLYNFPQMTGLSLSPALAARLARAAPGRIRGAKDSSGDLVLCRAAGRDPRFRCVSQRRGDAGPGAGGRFCRLHLGHRECHLPGCRSGCGATPTMPQPWPPAATCARPSRRIR